MTGLCWTLGHRHCQGRYPTHTLKIICVRPWRRLFRKTHHLRCWHCDIDIPEP